MPTSTSFIVVALVALISFAPRIAFACSCARHRETPSFVTHGAAQMHLPSNAKGVLFRVPAPTGPTTIGPREQPFVGLNQLPPAVDASRFEMEDLTTGKPVKVRVKKIDTGEGDDWHFYLAKEAGADVEQRIKTRRLKEITTQARARYGVFRIEPVAEFVANHRYRVTARVPPPDFGKEPAAPPQKDTRVSLEVSIDATSAQLSNAVTFEKDGPQGLRALSVPAGSMCSERVLATVQDVAFKWKDSLAPYQGWLYFRVNERAAPKRPVRYFGSVCSSPEWGRSEVGLGKELVALRCEGGEPSRTVELVGTWAFFEVDEKPKSSAPLTITLNTSGAACDPLEQMKTLTQKAATGELSALLCATARNHAAFAKPEAVGVLRLALGSKNSQVRVLALDRLEGIAQAGNSLDLTQEIFPLLIHELLGTERDDQPSPAVKDAGPSSERGTSGTIPSRMLDALLSVRALDAGVPIKRFALGKSPLAGVGWLSDIRCGLDLQRTTLAAATRLGNGKGDVRAALPALERALTREDELTRQQAQRIVEALGTSAPPRTADGGKR